MVIKSWLYTLKLSNQSYRLVLENFIAKALMVFVSYNEKQMQKKVRLPLYP